MIMNKKNPLILFVLTIPIYTSSISAAPVFSKKPPKIMEGAVIFKEYCSVCHGEKGDGKSRAQGGLTPKPKNFTAPVTISELSRSRMIFSVSYGRPNTAMSGWKRRLGQENIGRVVDYIRSTFMKLNVVENPETVPAIATQNLEDTIIKDDKIDPDFLKKPLPYQLDGKIKWGQIFYEDNCAECHGLKGDGNGPRSSFIFPKPRDYNHPASKQKYNRPILFDIIVKGSHRSEMAAWNKVLTYQEIGHISEYIFQAFINPDHSKKMDE